MANENCSVNFPPQDEKGEEKNEVYKAPRFYWFEGRLYPDNPLHVDFIQNKMPVFGLTYYGILHDKDRYDRCVYNVAGGKMEVSHKRGDLKKPHYHFMVRVSHNKTVKAFRSIVESWGLEPNLWNSCDQFGYTLYLTHKMYAGTPAEEYDKHVYCDDDIIGNKSAYLANLTPSGAGDDFVLFDQALSAFMELDNGLYTIVDAMRFMHSRGLYSVITRSYILTRMLEASVYEKRRIYRDLISTEELEEIWQKNRLKERKLNNEQAYWLLYHKKGI